MSSRPPREDSLTSAIMYDLVKAQEKTAELLGKIDEKLGKLLAAVEKEDGVLELLEATADATDELAQAAKAATTSSASPDAAKAFAEMMARGGAPIPGEQPGLRAVPNPENSPKGP